jgi:bla regulator protein BlaR1
MNWLHLYGDWERLSQWAWRTSLAASALMVLVWALQTVLGSRLSVRGRYLLSLLVLVRFLMPGIPAVSWSPWVLHGQPPLPARPVLSDAPPGWFAIPDPVASPSPSRITVRPQAQGSSAPGCLILFEVVWTLGMMISLGAVVWQHRRLARWIWKQPSVTDTAVLGLLEQCKTLAGVRAGLRLIEADHWQVPALWGWREPVLLLPANSLSRLSETELRFVLLHELAHVKRRDVLLNWVMIGARSLHWFNPLVWIALRRLRSDRELVCDQMVLVSLTPAERPVYGKVLLKLLESALSAPACSDASCPSLTSVVNNKHEMQKRILMIAHFKPTPRLTALATGVVLLLVGWISFTRADGPKTPPVAVPEHNATAEPSRNANSPSTLRKRLTELEKRIAIQQDKVDSLRLELAHDGNSLENPALSPETVRELERERITMEARAAEFQKLYDELKSKELAQLAQALPTAVPDTELAALLRDLNQTETAYSRVSQEYGPAEPRVRQAEAMLKTTKAQIQARIQGILTGLQAQAAAQLASAAAVSNQVQLARNMDAILTEKYRPYFIAKRELDTLNRLRDGLLLKVWTSDGDPTAEEIP